MFSRSLRSRLQGLRESGGKCDYKVFESPAVTRDYKVFESPAITREYNVVYIASYSSQIFSAYTI